MSKKAFGHGKLRNKNGASWERLPKFHKTALIVLGVFIILLILLPSQPSVEHAAKRKSVDLNLESLSEQPSDVAPRDNVKNKVEGDDKSVSALPVNTVSTSKPTPVIDEQRKSDKKAKVESISTLETKEKLETPVWKQHNIQKGETLYSLFRKYNLNLSELNKVLKEEKASKLLSQLNKGEIFRFKLNQQGDLTAFQIKRKASVVTYLKDVNNNFRLQK